MPQRPIAISNDLTLASLRICPCRLQPNGDVTEGAIATGFFWHDEQLCLITNWHNVTGWDPIRDTSLSKTGFFPEKLLVPFGTTETVSEGVLLNRQKLFASLYDNEGKALWWEHPTHGRNVDVIVLPLPELAGLEIANPAMNKFEGFFDFDISVGDDAFVLGYPLGLDGGHDFPIWKRASIASEPDVDMDQLPKLLIDTATRKGMSGSPVIARRSGLIRPRGSKGQALTGHEVLGSAAQFLGIYSGRVDDDPLGAQIGIVWKRSLIDEIVKAKRRGTGPHQS